MSPTEMVLWELDSPEQRPVSPHDCTQNIGSSSKCSLQKPCGLHVVQWRWMQVAGRSTWSGHRSANCQRQHANPRGCPRGIPLIRTEMQLRPAEFPERGVQGVQGVQGVHVVMCQGFCLGQQKMNPLPPQPFGSFVCPKAAAIDRMSFPF